MPKILLSQNAEKALNHVYQKYLLRKTEQHSNHYLLKSFPIDSLFPNKNEKEIINTIIELSKNEFIWFFSDRRIMLKEKGINYIEDRLAKGFIKPHDYPM